MFTYEEYKYFLRGKILFLYILLNIRISEQLCFIDVLKRWAVEKQDLPGFSFVKHW